MTHAVVVAAEAILTTGPDGFEDVEKNNIIKSQYNVYTNKKAQNNVWL